MKGGSRQATQTGSVMHAKKAPPKGTRRLPADCGPPSVICDVGGWWAHQDSNLEQAGYEPAAVTVELWAPGECNVKFRV